MHHGVVTEIDCPPGFESEIANRVIEQQMSQTHVGPSFRASSESVDLRKCGRRDVDWIDNMAEGELPALQMSDQRAAGKRFGMLDSVSLVIGRQHGAPNSCQNLGHEDVFEDWFDRLPARLMFGDRRVRPSDYMATQFAPPPVHFPLCRLPEPLQWRIGQTRRAFDHMRAMRGNHRSNFDSLSVVQHAFLWEDVLWRLTSICNQHAVAVSKMMSSQDEQRSSFARSRFTRTGRREETC